MHEPQIRVWLASQPPRTSRSMTSDVGSQQHPRASTGKGRTTIGECLHLSSEGTCSRDEEQGDFAPLTPYDRVPRLESTPSRCLTFGGSSDPRASVLSSGGRAIYFCDQKNVVPGDAK